MAKKVDGISIRMEGDKEMKRILNGMSMMATKKFVQGNMKLATAPGIKTIKSDTKVGRTGNLKRSIGYKNVRGSGPLVYSGIVGARMGRGGQYGKGWHANLYAYGHVMSGWFKHLAPARVRGVGQWIQRGMIASMPQMVNTMDRRNTTLFNRIVRKFGK